LDIYTKKKRAKFILFGLAVVIVSFSLWNSNVIVRKFTINQRSDVKIWADAIQQKAKLVKYTEVFFDQLSEEESKRAGILAEAYTIIGNPNFTGDLTFHSQIIKSNTTIPVIITNKSGKITEHVNYEFESDTITHFSQKIKREFSVNPRITISYLPNEVFLYLYYKDSRLFAELRSVLDDLVESFFSEVVKNSASVPVIVTDSTQQIIIDYGNIDSLRMMDSVFAKKLLSEMRDENAPIKLNLPDQGTTYIFYQDSFLVKQIQYYPYIQFFIIGLFLVIAYFLFSSARRAEQNQVWVGMSKETAHQIGTPLSSLMGWIELLKLKGFKDEALPEMEKDIDRLEKITERFSKIGSQAKLSPQNIVELVQNTVSYFKTRSSKKIHYHIKNNNKEIIAPINLLLFDWVIENLCKNAVDAMAGKGEINIDINEEDKQVIIDFSDSGKGIPKSMHKTIFNPGYTSKKRGWGLGLTLSQRIIAEYHKGKIFVRNSTPEEGTTFRIILKK
jgi:signal transduction histidine kinase